MAFLSPYRVLDLTDERGLLAGKIFADLGADVIQVEPVGGSYARHMGPFRKDFILREILHYDDERVSTLENVSALK